MNGYPERVLTYDGTTEISACHVDRLGVDKSTSYLAVAS